MARIAGVDLPRGKRIEVALTYIYGIGRTRSTKILDACGVDPSRRTQDLNDEEINLLRKQIEGDYKVEGALRTETSMNIKRLMDIGCYRGLRHRRGLPVRDRGPTPMPALIRDRGGPSQGKRRLRRSRDTSGAGLRL
jgi:small subunit ribosomal protein S13